MTQYSKQKGSDGLVYYIESRVYIYGLNTSVGKALDMNSTLNVCGFKLPQGQIFKINLALFYNFKSCLSDSLHFFWKNSSKILH